MKRPPFTMQKAAFLMFIFITTSMSLIRGKMQVNIKSKE